MFDYKVTNSALDNLLVVESENFIDFSIKRGVRKLPQSFFLVEDGPPNNQSTVSVGHFDVSLHLVRFSSAALTSEERLENLVLQLKLSLLMS